MPEVLIVDDQEGVAVSTAILLKRAGYHTDVSLNPEKAIDLLSRRQYDLVLADLCMDGMSGLDLLKYIRSQASAPEVIMITAYGTIDSAVAATKEGAFDYICKPYRSDDLLMRISKAIEKRTMMLELDWRRKDFCARSGSQTVIAECPKMTALFDRARVLAQSTCTILITGETGTGKGLLASSIHALSPRAGKPFVGLNCANLSETLLESELFGAAKGAFTGAHTSRRGLCEAAAGGTLFLDEVACGSLTIQSKLLTLLEEKCVRRLGDTRSVPVDIRIITATNANLSDMIRRHEFREDLFYRLNVASLHVPALRERAEDIPVLANHFLKLFATRYSRPIYAFSPQAMQNLKQNPFPGNVRQLENLIEQAVVRTESETITLKDLDTGVASPDAGPSNEERDLLLKSIADNKFNVRRTATELGVSRTTIYRMLHRNGIRAR